MSATLKALPKPGANGLSPIDKLVQKYLSPIINGTSNDAGGVLNTIQNSPLGQAAQGKFSNVPAALDTELQNVGWKAKPGDKPQDTAMRFASHNAMAGEMANVSDLPLAGKGFVVKNSPGDSNIVGDMSGVRPNAKPIENNPFPKYRLSGGSADPETGLTKGGSIKQVKSNPAPKYSQEDPTYPKAESIDMGKVNKEWDTSQWPQTPEKTTSATVKKPFKLPGQHDPIEQTSAPNAAKSSKAYSKTTPDIQEAYRRNGITDPKQVYNTKQSLYDSKINPVLQGDQTRLPIGDMATKTDGLIPKIVKEIQKMSPTIDDSEANKAATKMAIKLGDIARNEGDPTSKGISLKGALDYKTMLNDSNAVQNYFDNIRPNTPEDMATVATRNVLQNSLEKYAPQGITQAVKDYGLLEEGFPSYLKAASNPPKLPTLQVLGTKIPLDPIVKGTSAALKNPIVRGAGLIGIGAGAMAALPEIKNLYGNLTQNDKSNADGQKGLTGTHPNSISQDVNNQPIPKSADQIQVDPKTGSIGVINPYTYKGADGQTLAISQTQYVKEKSDLNGQISALDKQMSDNPRNFDIQKSNASKIAGIQSQLDSLNARNTESRSLDESYQNAQATSSSISKAKKDIVAGGADILKANGDVNKLATILDGKYSQMAAVLKHLQDTTGIPIFQPGMSSATILANLDQAGKIAIYNKYYSLLGGSYTGGAQTPNPQSVPQGTRPLPTPQATGLPPIPNGGEEGQAFTPDPSIKANLNFVPGQ